MGEIVDINANKPHLVAELICVKCTKRWIGVWPEELSLKEIICPACSYRGAVIKTGQNLEE